MSTLERAAIERTDWAIAVKEQEPQAYARAIDLAVTDNLEVAIQDVGYLMVPLHSTQELSV